MNKINHDKRVFDMINLLRENGKMKMADIQKKLGLKSRRSIYQYKKRILQLGIDIRSDEGFFGGYYIVDKRLNKKEIQKLEIILKNEKELYEKIKKINSNYIKVNDNEN